MTQESWAIVNKLSDSMKEEKIIRMKKWENILSVSFLLIVMAYFVYQVIIYFVK